MAKEYYFEATKPVDPHVVTAEVLRSRRVTASMQRVTFSGPELSKFSFQGYDQWFRLFLSREGQDSLKLPTSTSSLWYAQYLLTAKDKRPWVRNYTVRDWRETESGPELDVDFVVHEDGGTLGPAVNFALNAPVGTSVGILDQGLSYSVGRKNSWQLLVSDETGLPALLGIINSTPSSVAIEAFVEVPSLDDIQPYKERSNVTVHWVPRNGSHGKPGELALDAVTLASLPAEPPYACVYGEQALATGVRRFLVNERNVPKQDVTFVGYWRHGQAAGH